MEKKPRIAGNMLNDTKSTRNIMYRVLVGYMYSIMPIENIDKEVVGLTAVKNLADKKF
jgi:hypothetical protein